MAKNPWSPETGEAPARPIKLELEKHLTVKESNTEVVGHFDLSGQANLGTGAIVGATFLNTRAGFTRYNYFMDGRASVAASGEAPGGLNAGLLVNPDRPTGVVGANMGDGMVNAFKARAIFRETKHSLGFGFNLTALQVEAKGAKGGGLSGGLGLGFNFSNNSSRLGEMASAVLEGMSKKGGSLNAGAGTFVQFLPDGIKPGG